MVAIRIPLCLYFHTGVLPSADDEAAKVRIEERGIKCVFRNADQVADLAMSPLEECDSVAGLVPARYTNAGKTAPEGLSSEIVNRLSDYDRRHGPVASVDNELARAAKPPSVGSDKMTSQGADRPHGAMTLAGGGWVAPVPGNPSAVAAGGSERAENGPEGSRGEGQQGRHANPHGLPDAGVLLPAQGTTGAAALAGTAVVAEGGGTGAFVPPEPVEPGPSGDSGASGDTGSTGKRKRGGDSGDSGATA